jgi:transposase
MEVLHPRCAGIDVSKTDAKVCVRVVPKGRVRAREEVTTWGATSSQILALGERLVAERVTCVVMEATGDYWKPFYYLLSDAGLDVVLANPRSVRQIPGRKTDVADAVWLAQLGAHGLVRASFVPPLVIRELKDLVRARTTFVRMRGQEAQRLEKLLEDAAVKLSSTISNLVGLSGRRMIEAMIAGDSTPDEVAGLADRRVKASREELAEALTGRFTEHHARLAQAHLRVIDFLSDEIAGIEAAIEAYFTDDDDHAAPRADAGLRADLRVKRELLDDIPGVSATVAEMILAEIGPDMSVFPTPGQLASWAGVAPGSNESAGKVKSSKCRPGNTYLKGALGIAALSASKSKDTFLAARYKRVLSRRGRMRALVAIEHSILTAVWHILATGEPYQELGGDYYIKRRPGVAIRKAVQQLRAAGCDVTFTDNTAIITA